MGNRALLVAFMGILCVGMAFAGPPPMAGYHVGDCVTAYGKHYVLKDDKGAGPYWDEVDSCSSPSTSKRGRGPKKTDAPGVATWQIIQHGTAEDARHFSTHATDIVTQNDLGPPPKGVLSREEFEGAIKKEKHDQIVVKGPDPTDPAAWMKLFYPVDEDDFDPHARPYEEYKREMKEYVKEGGSKGSHSAGLFQKFLNALKEQQSLKEEEAKGSDTDHFELPEVTIGLKSYGLGSVTGYRRTKLDRDIATVDGDRVKSEAFSETVTFAYRTGDWTLHALMPIERERYRGDADVLDNTSLGLVVAPVYHLMKREVHGFDVNVGVNAGYHHTWYDEESDLDKPLGTRWGVGDFNNPDLFTAGPMVGAICPAWAGYVALGLAYQWTRDLNGDDMLAGDDDMAYTTAKLRVEQALSESIYAAVDMTFSYTNDVPSHWDDSVFASAVEVGWQGESWSVGGAVGRAWANDDLNEVSYTLTAGVTW